MAGTSIDIAEIDHHDVGGLVAVNDAMRRAYVEDRDAVFWRSDAATVAQFASPPREGVRRVVLAARAEGEVVGGAEITAERGEPTEVEIGVVPRHRRRGIGRALLAAALDRLGDDEQPWQSEMGSDHGVAFALDAGLEIAHQEGRYVLALPIDPGRLDRLSADHPVDPAVEVLSWVGACPESVVGHWARLTTQMDEDSPRGDLTRHSSLTPDVDAVRRNETRMDEQGYDMVRTLARIDDVPVGYTVVFVPRAEPEIAVQDDTLVDRDHRGRGIGRALKTANLRSLTTLPAARDTRWMQTWVDDDNTPMVRLNERLGFRRADTLTIVEGRPSLSRRG